MLDRLLRRLHLSGSPEKRADGDSDMLPLIMRVLRQSLPNHWRAYAVSFVFMGLTAAATAAAAWIMRDMVNSIFIERDLKMLLLISGAVCLLFVFRGLATYFATITLSRVGNRLVAQNQQQLFDHVLLMDVKFFTSSQSSDLITRVSYGAQAARKVVQVVVTSLGRDLLTVIGLGIVMVVQAPIMALATVIVAPVAVLGAASLGRQIRSFARSEITGMTQIVAVIQETSHGARIVKSFGLNDYMRDRMAGAIAGVERQANMMAMLTARTSPLMESLAGIAICLVILFTGWQAIAFDRTPGEFMAFITALLLAYEPAKRLAKLHVELAGLLVMVKAMFDLLDILPGATEVANAPALNAARIDVELREVSFAYRPQIQVLKGISFKVEAGQTVALVGPSGGGKTTILNLIQRFYDVDSGAVIVGARDIREVSVASLRAAISYVSQDTYLFSGTLRDNIRLGNLSATDAEVEQAARSAAAEDFILALEHGYDTWVGENGVKLSGGQRQRIAIARAILRSAPIILLDEATASLDSSTERKIQEAFKRLTAGRAAIVIAHRLSTVMQADKILVIDRGEVVQSGRHDELLRNGGLYKELCEHQFPGAFVEPIRAVG